MGCCFSQGLTIVLALFCSICLCVFFFQAEDGIRDDLVTGVQTCALPILPILAAAAPPLFILPISRCGSARFFLPKSRCGSAPSFYPAHFLLRQRPALFCPILVAPAPLHLILTNTCCGSAPAFYTAHFSLRQRPSFNTYQFSLRQHPRFLYCLFLVAAAPRLFILPNSRCGSTPAF